MPILEVYGAIRPLQRMSSLRGTQLRTGRTLRSLPLICFMFSFSFFPFLSLPCLPSFSLSLFHPSLLTFSVFIFLSFSLFALP
jgi:hypothetical protein